MVFFDYEVIIGFLYAKLKGRMLLSGFIYLSSLCAATIDWINLCDRSYQITDNMTNWGVFEEISLLFIAIIVFFHTKDRVNQVIIYLSIIIIAADTVIFFAELFKKHGLTSDGFSPQIDDQFPYMYFSIVTWTTVGYGDFSPNRATRIYAATEPVIAYFAMVLIFTIGAKIFIDENKTPTKEIIEKVKLRFLNTFLFVLSYYFLAFILTYKWDLLNANGVHFKEISAVLIISFFVYAAFCSLFIFYGVILS